MINLLQTELYKLLKNRSFWKVCLSMILVYGIMFYLVVIEWWSMESSSLESLGLKSFTAIEMLKVSMFYNLFISALAAAFINSDHTTGVVKNQIIGGHSRSTIYLAKALVFSLASIFAVVMIPFVLTFAIVFIFGKANILNSTNMEFLIQAFLLYALGIAAYSSLIMLIASAVKESGKTILFTILMTIVAVIIEMIVIPPWPIVEKLYSFTVFSQGYVAFSIDKNILQSVMVSLIHFVVLLFWGCRRFEKEEVK